MNILLIDKRISQYENIVAAVDGTLAKCIVFDYFNDTFDTLKARMSELGVTPSARASVGLIQHNYRTPMFSMLASADVAPVAQVATQDPDLTRWTQFRDFIGWCKTEFSIAHFDMMACALYSDPNWKYVIDTLATQTGVEIRASTDNTGSAQLGGDWFLESHTGVNLKGVYFTELIEEYRGILFLNSYNIREYSTKGLSTGGVVAWGDSNYGGSITDVSNNLTSGVVAVYSTQLAFAALKTDGSVQVWGDTNYGVDMTNPGITGGVVSICSTIFAFAALKNDGSVQAWGAPGFGGSDPGITGGVVSIYSNNYAFAALKTDGSVVAWGDPGYGGSDPGITGGVVSIYSNSNAFAALKTDGSVVAWGHPDYGGADPGITGGVVSIYSTSNAFAALKNDGSIQAWGFPTYGGTDPGVTGGVVAVYSTSFNFAALKTDGSVQVWGAYGGPFGGITGVVVAVYSTESAFAALKNDGSVQAWGAPGYGGSDPGITGGVVAVYSTAGSFAALKSDGSVQTWGASWGGGDSTTVASDLSGVVSVYSSNYAFAALKSDGSVVTWGSSDFGSDSSAVASDLSSGIVSIYSAPSAFAALKSDATTFDLSAAYYRDIDRYDILRKKENRRRVDLTALNNNDTWTSRTGAADNQWVSVAYGDGLWVAVAATGAGNRVMTSPDGINWTIGTSIPDNQWSSVAYGNGLWVAVAQGGVDRVMTSPDGINWTIIPDIVWNSWRSVAYGDGLWVAVASSGTGNRVMTSPDGTTWTLRTSAADNFWISVAYGNGLWVAVAASGTGNRVMTSPDGINWTSRTSAADNDWISVAYGNGLWVAVAESGTGNRVMTSPDGITWTSRTSAADNDWHSVAYGNGLWVAVALSGTGNRVMTSPNGITWTIRTSAANNFWVSVAYGNGLWVAVSYNDGGTGNNVMTSGENIILSNARDIQSFNPAIPSGNTLRIIVPDYVASSYSITSTATIPNSTGSFIVACDESEPVDISGVTYVNYGSFVYKRETDNTYTKLTSATINGRSYTLYGGDGINSSGLVFVSTTDAPPTPTPQITYWSSQADALNGNLSNALGYNDANFTVGQYSSGSSAFTSWRIASNSTGPSSQVAVYVNGDVLTDNGTGGYYFLYPVVPPTPQITYWSSQADALNGNLSNALGYNDANFTVGQYSSGSSAFTSWRIASNSTGPSSQVAVYVNGDVLTDNGTGGYYFLYPVVPCFLEGSTILALVDGVDTFVPVETLRRGSMVKTYQHGYKAVEAIGYNTLFNGIDSVGARSENSLFKCCPAKYPELSSPLIITGGHSILVDKLTQHQKDQTIKSLGRLFKTDDKYRLTACNDERSDPWGDPKTYTVWHFALENKEPAMNYGVYANGGLLVESCSIRFLKTKSNMALV